MLGIWPHLFTFALAQVTLVTGVSQQTTPQVEKPRHTITGTVTNAITGEPIRRALVQVSGANMNAGALTGPDGRFQLEDVPEGQVFLFPAKPGYFDARQMQSGGMFQNDGLHTVRSGNNDFAVVLYPAAKIVGRLTDGDGQPVEGIQIQALRNMIMSGRKYIQPVGASATDDDGNYRLDNLQPGRYMVLELDSHILPVRMPGSRREMNSPTYYPDSDSMGGAQTIELKAGEEYRADFQIRLVPAYRVTGKLQGVAPNSVLAFWLENIEGDNLSGFFRLHIDPASNEFMVDGITKGSWTLAFQAGDQSGHQLRAYQQIRIDSADIDELQIWLQPNASIPVILNHSANLSDPPAVNLSLTNVGSLSIFTHNTQIDNSNSSFQEIPSGKYRLGLVNAGNECVDSAWYGDVDLLKDYMTVSPSASGQRLTVNLRSDCASLSAKFSGENQKKDGSVLIYPDFATAEPYVLQVFGNRPVAAIRLTPGTYQVYAFSSIQDLEYSNREVLRQYRSQTVTLVPNQKLEITVELY